MSAGTDSTARFAIFRAKEPRSDAEMAEMMTYEELSPAAAEGSRLASEVGGAQEGAEVKCLFATPGFSLLYVWFKSGFPLTRHSHNADCLYYIIGGSLKIGDQDLGVGDGFFVGKDVPYTYTPGPSGVEVLEFRNAETFNIKVLADNPAYWIKMVETLKKGQSGWRTEPRPSAKN